MFSIDLSGWGDALAAVVDFVREHWATIATAVVVVFVMSGIGSCNTSRLEKKIEKVQHELGELRFSVGCETGDDRKACITRVENLIVEHSAYSSALSVCQANQAALEVGVARCNADVEAMRLMGLQARREVERRLDAARRDRDDAHTWAHELHSRLAAEESCTEQVRMALEAVMP